MQYRTEIELTAEQAAKARELGEATYERYKTAGGHYRNIKRSHILGKLAEVGVEQWLRAQAFDPDPAYRDLDREADPDLIVGSVGIEVKSWRPATWDEMGRCVTPAQLKTIEKKAAAVVWCVVDDERDPPLIGLAGWSKPSDVACTEVRPTGPDYRPVLNHQVEIGDIRPLVELVEHL